MRARVIRPQRMGAVGSDTRNRWHPLSRCNNIRGRMMTSLIPRLHQLSRCSKLVFTRRIVPRPQTNSTVAWLSIKYQTSRTKANYSLQTPLEYSIMHMASLTIQESALTRYRRLWTWTRLMKRRSSSSRNSTCLRNLKKFETQWRVGRAWCTSRTKQVLYSKA